MVILTIVYKKKKECKLQQTLIFGNLSYMVWDLNVGLLIALFFYFIALGLDLLDLDVFLENNNLGINSI